MPYDENEFEIKKYILISVELNKTVYVESVDLKIFGEKFRI